MHGRGRHAQRARVSGRTPGCSPTTRTRARAGTALRAPPLRPAHAAGAPLPGGGAGSPQAKCAFKLNDADLGPPWAALQSAVGAGLGFQRRSLPECTWQRACFTLGMLSPLIISPALTDYSAQGKHALTNQRICPPCLNMD